MSGVKSYLGICTRLTMILSLCSLSIVTAVTAKGDISNIMTLTKTHCECEIIFTFFNENVQVGYTQKLRLWTLAANNKLWLFGPICICVMERCTATLTFSKIR